MSTIGLDKLSYAKVTEGTNGDETYARARFARQGDVRGTQDRYQRSDTLRRRWRGRGGQRIQERNTDAWDRQHRRGGLRAIYSVRRSTTTRCWCPRTRRVGSQSRSASAQRRATASIATSGAIASCSEFRRRTSRQRAKTLRSRPRRSTGTIIRRNKLDGQGNIRGKRRSQ